MKRIIFARVRFAALAGIVVATASVSVRSGGEAAPIYVKLPRGCRDWCLISVCRLAGSKSDPALVEAHMAHQLGGRGRRFGALSGGDGISESGFYCVGERPRGHGFKARRPDELRGAIAEAFAVGGPAIVDSVVAADEMLNVPHIELEPSRQLRHREE